ncbi:MAG: antibiotic biosynthesis monooxygenase family protein, partial [Pseudomonadota bacterium]
RDMPGNLAYLIAEDLEDPAAIWITEVWKTKTDHANSLKLPSVQAAIATARQHITGFGTRAETRPVTSV